MMEKSKGNNSQAKAKTRAESDTRTLDYDTDISAAELKEFLELEIKAKQQYKQEWWQNTPAKKAGYQASTKAILMAGLQQPFIPHPRPEPSQPNKIRNSLQERLGLKILSNPLTHPVSSQTGQSKPRTASDLIKQESVEGQASELPEEFKPPIKLIDKQSPLIKTKTDLKENVPLSVTNLRKLSQESTKVKESKIGPKAT